MDLKIELRSGVYHLNGHLDEEADLSELAAADPLRVHLEALLSMNSPGTAAWLTLMRGVGKRKVELHECPRWFIETANAIPDILGTTDQASRVVSLYVPYRCDNCSVSIDALVPMRSVKLGRHGVELARFACKKCRESIPPSVDLQDYFLFLIDAGR